MLLLLPNNFIKNNIYRHPSSQYIKRNILPNGLTETLSDFDIDEKRNERKKKEEKEGRKERRSQEKYQLR